MKGYTVRESEKSSPSDQISPITVHQTQNGEKITITVFTTDQILLWSERDRARLRQELEALYAQAFPRMSKHSLEEFVCHYFRPPVEKFQLYAMFFRNPSRDLVATSIFVSGEVTYAGIVMNGAQIIVSAVSPEYQGAGIAQIIGVKILTEWRPDVLFTTCAQSAALYARIGLVEKALINEFEVYPRLERRDDQDIVVTVPYKDLDFAITTFMQTYFVGFASGNQETANKTLRNLTVLMARKEIDVSYGFDPWKDDKIAKTLGVGVNDGVLVMFRKKS
jgi:hypothetical protein